MLWNVRVAIAIRYFSPSSASFAFGNTSNTFLPSTSSEVSPVPFSAALFQ